MLSCHRVSLLALLHTRQYSPVCFYSTLMRLASLWVDSDIRLRKRGATWQEEWSTRFETDFGETAAEASTAAADHGRAPVPELSLQDIDAAIDKEMASPQVPFSANLVSSLACFQSSLYERCPHD